MKKSVIIFIALSGIIACGAIVLNWKNPSPAVPAPAVEPVAQASDQAEPEETVAPRSAEPQTASVQPVEPAAISAPEPARNDVKPASADAALGRTVDLLVSAQTSFGDRQAMWKKLKAAGELDQVVAELKQRAAGNPDDPAIPTAIGEALMHKFPIADPDESAMNGLLMDQSFNKALKLDPTHWEAQFFKATELAYWPAEFNKGPEVVQRFSALIDQQEKMPVQPQFAQTYASLGDYYQKTGQAGRAAATWQLGLMKFPNDPTLQKKISGQ